MSKQIFIFRGAPASGKGTITKEFIPKVPGKVAYLELDMFRWNIHLCDREISEVTKSEHRLGYKNYLSVLENYLDDGGYTIVTEGLFAWNDDGPHGSISDILTLSDRYNVKAHPILLYADYEVLWRRNQQREYSVPKNEFDELHEYVMNEQSEEEIKLDVGKLSVKESVHKLAKHLPD